MKCPVCRATYRSPGIRDQGSGIGDRGNDPFHPPLPAPLPCHRCGVDLSPLIHLHDQALWFYRQAIQAMQAGDYQTATSWNQQALALHGQNADFHALAGQLWALQGEFRQAIVAWKTAQQLNPQHHTANDCLQALGRYTRDGHGG